MREEIENKINDIIKSILAKNVDDITYSEYKILDCRSKDLKYNEDQEKRSEEISQLMAKTFGYGFGSTPTILPEPEIKED